MGNNPKPGTPEEFTQTVAQYVARWTGVIEKLGIGALSLRPMGSVPSDCARIQFTPCKAD